MKFIKVFDTDSEYLSFRDGGGYEKPNVSLSKDTKEVHYNYPIWDNNGHDFVDLGLPSGTLWSTMNVGASKLSDYGLYFQWGDTVGYTSNQVGQDKQFDLSNYKFYTGSSFTKYGKIGETTLELEDDAAHVHMGGSWHIPSPAQINELLSNTTNTWTTQDGVNGRLFTSTKDTSKSIFIPAGGMAKNGLVNNIGNHARIWSAILVSNNLSDAQMLFLTVEKAVLAYSLRCNGIPVRGVLGY